MTLSKKNVEKATLPKYEDYQKDSNPFPTIEIFLTKRTSFFSYKKDLVFSFLCGLRRRLQLNICLLGLRFCKNNLIFISSRDNHRGTLSCY